MVVPPLRRAVIRGRRCRIHQRRRRRGGVKKKYFFPGKWEGRKDLDDEAFLVLVGIEEV